MRRVLRELRAGEAGYSVIELLTVLGIMGIVIGGLTTVFVQAAAGEVDMNRRFQAQQDGRVALDRLRRETHCAKAITPAGPASSVTLEFPVGCRIGIAFVTWCVVAVPGDASRFRLYRSTADPCGDGADRIYADHLRIPAGLTQPTLFEHTVQSSESLGRLRVTLPVQVDTERGGAYTLTDTFTMRNSARSCIAGSPPPC